VRMPALMIAACLAAAAGCGGDGGSGDEAGTPAPGSAPRPGVGATLDQDGLDTVHDNLYECLRKAGGGVLARYVNGQASVADTFGNAEYDDRLAAPKTETKLLDAGDAQFIGVRADHRDTADRGRPDVDVLIFPSADRAEEALPALQAEAGTAERDGLFVRVAKSPGSGATGRKAARALQGCFVEARPGA
jgi:hypothetical protein